MVNLRLGQSMNTYDPAEALRGEHGKFRVTTPSGDKLEILCKPNNSIASLRWAGDTPQGATHRPGSGAFLIEKIAEINQLETQQPQQQNNDRNV